MPDLDVIHGGSVYLVTPCTEAGRDWVEENVPDRPAQFAGGFGVEPRYIEDLTKGAIEHGLGVEFDGKPLFIGDEGSVCYSAAA